MRTVVFLGREDSAAIMAALPLAVSSINSCPVKSRRIEVIFCLDIEQGKKEAIFMSFYAIGFVLNVVSVYIASANINTEVIVGREGS